MLVCELRLLITITHKHRRMLIHRFVISVYHEKIPETKTKREEMRNEINLGLCQANWASGVRSVPGPTEPNKSEDSGEYRVYQLSIPQAQPLCWLDRAG